MAGADSPQLQTEAEMIKAIRETGRTPVQRDTFYQPIRVLDESATVAVGPEVSENRLLENNLATA